MRCSPSRQMRLGMVLCMLLVVLPRIATADPVRFRADYWCPYNCDPTEQYPGYMIEIAQRALARLGLTVDYQLMPWDRTMSEVRAGSVDVAVGATTLESDGLILSDILGVDADCFFVTAGNPWRYTGVASLPHVLLGAVSGYTHDEGEIDAYIAANDAPNGRVMTTAGDTASSRNLRLLFVGRVDAVLDSRAVLLMEAAKLGHADELVNAGCLGSLPLYLAISPKRADAQALVGALRDEVGDLRKSGQLAEILGHYGLSDWQQ